MTKAHLVEQLRDAAAQIAEMSSEELKALLLKAAEHLSEAELDGEYLALIREMNAAGQEPFGANEVVKDWLIGQGRLGIVDLDEDSETKGSA